MISYQELAEGNGPDEAAATDRNTIVKWGALILAPRGMEKVFIKNTFSIISSKARCYIHRKKSFWQIRGAKPYVFKPLSIERGFSILEKP